jgi:Putative peptidoglycan binding domain/CHAP domain
VASPLLVGADVLAVQRRLLALGYDPGPLDGVYGPAVADAVVQFQTDRLLDADGIVGPSTRTAFLRPAPPPRRAASDGGRRALAEAGLHVGVRESPASSNRTEFGSWFGVNGVPWSGIFASYCFAVGAGVVLCAGFRGAGCTPRGCAYVPTIEGWLRATGRWKGSIVPQPGDLAVYDFDGSGPDHVGIVEEAYANGSFSVIEGNTSLRRDADGGEVMRRVRPLDLALGFGRIL